MKNRSSRIKRKIRLLSVLLSIVCILYLCSCGIKTADASKRFDVAVAWSNNQESYTYVSTLQAIEAAGGNPVVLEMARSFDLSYDKDGNLIGAVNEQGFLTSDAAKLVKNNTWQNSNVEQVLEGVNCIVFPGGSDISPTLFYEEEAWHGIEGDTNYSAERDVSDYILLSYCLEKDIPTLAVCRGMEMLAVVSGAQMIQDLPTWFEKQGITYHFLHRDPEKKDLVPHDTAVLSHDSLLYQITGQDTLTGVPSWHHQAVESVDNTRLTVTAQTETDGLPVVEAVERSDKTFCLGLQCHPEVAVRKRLDNAGNAEDFMDNDTALSFFKALIQAGYQDSR